MIVCVCARVPAPGANGTNKPCDVGRTIRSGSGTLVQPAAEEHS
jgi:hypothetical protein